MFSGVDIGAQNSEGNTPLHIACHKGWTGVTEFLIEEGVNVTALNNMGETPLHLAATNRHIKCMKALFQRGIKTLLFAISNLSKFGK